MIFPYWSAEFRRQFGGAWPRNYLCFDTETSGFDMKRDVIMQIAHCLIEDGKEVSNLDVVLDWSDHPVVPDAWLRQKLKYTAESMLARTGRKFHWTYERMKEEGIRPPEKVLQFYLDLFNKTQHLPIAAHSGNFDENIFEANLAGFHVAESFRFDDNRMFDTSAIERAHQMAGELKATPRPGETLRTYFARLRAMRVPIKTALDEYCAKRYNFKEKLGITGDQYHDALVDSRCVHVIMEENAKLWCPPFVRQPTLREPEPIVSKNFKDDEHFPPERMPDPPPAIVQRRFRGQRAR